MDGLTVFERYLQQREEALRRFHPQWDFTNDEIDQCNDLLKRDTTPICIPPSWDLVQKYAGALDENADGYDKDLYKRGKKTFIGDQGKAEFLDLMRNLEIGGILIGNIDTEHLLYGAELPNNKKEDYMVPTPNNIMKPLKKAGQFELDFLYFHPHGGLFLIEIKKRSDSRTASVAAANTFAVQIRKHKAKLSWLIETLVNNSGGTEQNVAQIMSNITCLVIVNCVLFFEDGTSTENMLEYFQGQARSRYNFFREKYFQNIIIFLAGYRPDFFISPVQCALRVRDNIFKHRINRENFYCKNLNESVQNIAKTVKDFLSTMPSFINKSIKFVRNTDINFGKYSNIYLTVQQQDAVGYFDHAGNYFPKRQILFGPPGSGKSLILVLKIFIIGQMESRKDRILFCGSEGTERAKKLDEFILRNRSKFYRHVTAIEPEAELNDIKFNNGCDVILDEQVNADIAINRYGFLLTDIDQIVALVVASEVDAAKYYEVSGAVWIEFQVTRLHTVFRSTKQIQNYFQRFSTHNVAYVSGHNFDGVKVEEWIYDDKESMRNALSNRIQRLVTTEGCTEKDVGLFLRKKLSKPPLIGNVFADIKNLLSLAFPVMIVVEPDENEMYLAFSRAICHLIVFTLHRLEGKKQKEDENVFMFREYLARRDELLTSFHPQWKLSNEEVAKSEYLLKLKDPRPICIPPSRDLVQKFAGSSNPNADGHNSEKFGKLYRLFVGDRSEAEFVDVMGNLKIGGILVGNIGSNDLLNMEKLKHEENFRLPDQLKLMIEKDRNFEIDFVYFHQTGGIFHFEVKTASHGKKAQNQLTRNAWVLKQLFIAYCQILKDSLKINLWDSCYFNKSILYISDGKQKLVQCQSSNNGPSTLCEMIWGKDELKKLKIKEKTTHNFFQDDFFCGFMLLIAGFRPPFFISPVKCAWIVQDNIFRHYANILNYYKKDIKDNGIHINAGTLADYLDSLEPFISRKDIDFGTRKHIYLTQKQLEAVGKFDETGNFMPTCQLITGPPGSGKSLILMIKIFVLAQIPKDTPLYFTSGSPVHLKELKSFVNSNNKKFCRTPEPFSNTREKRRNVADKCADVVADESFQRDLKKIAIELTSTNPDQIIAIVATGINGDLMSIDHSLPLLTINDEWFVQNGYKLTPMTTVFRSTLLIQNYFFKSSIDTNKEKSPLISGHNFHGVRVEKWYYPNMDEDMPKFVKERISILVGVEEIEKNNICIFRGEETTSSEVCSNFFYQQKKEGFTVLGLTDARSMEFPIVLVVEANDNELFLAASRAMCHLIVFREKISKQKTPAMQKYLEPPPPIALVEPNATSDTESPGELWLQFFGDFADCLTIE